MGSYQDSVLTAWKQVNQEAASLSMTGAAPAFRHAVAQTDFKSLAPAWEFGNYRIYVLDWLEGAMVWVDNSQGYSVVGHHLWAVICSDYGVMEQFIDDLAQGADGVKLIDYNTGPYREAGKAWRESIDDLAPQQSPIDELRTRIERIVDRVAAINDAGGERNATQYQALFQDLGGADEELERLRGELDTLAALLDTARGAVAAL